METTIVLFQSWEPSCCPDTHPGYYWTVREERVTGTDEEIDAQVEAWNNTSQYDRVVRLEDC